MDDTEQRRGEVAAWLDTSGFCLKCGQGAGGPKLTGETYRPSAYYPPRFVYQCKRCSHRGHVGELNGTIRMLT